jgi:hypothetical protein
MAATLETDITRLIQDTVAKLNAESPWRIVDYKIDELNLKEAEIARKRYILAIKTPEGRWRMTDANGVVWYVFVLFVQKAIRNQFQSKGDT